MNPKRFHYLFIAALLAFCLVGAIIGYAIFLGVVHASDNLIVANNSENQLEQRITALQKLSNSIQSVSAPLESLSVAIPKEHDVPGLVADLEAAANSSGVNISDLDFSANATQKPTPAPTAGAKAVTTPAAAVPVKSGPTPIPFKMEAVGSYAQMTTFLDRLAHLSRYVDFSQFSLIKPHKEADQVDITFQANAYAQ